LKVRAIALIIIKKPVVLAHDTICARLLVVSSVAMENDVIADIGYNLKVRRHATGVRQS
jgi:hypothetical protein